MGNGELALTSIERIDLFIFVSFCFARSYRAIRIPVFALSV
jgi:hypothetical protein